MRLWLMSLRWPKRGLTVPTQGSHQIRIQHQIKDGRSHGTDSRPTHIRHGNGAWAGPERYAHDHTYDLLYHQHPRRSEENEQKECQVIRVPCTGI